MKLLYINYWSIADPLTEATVFPNLKILQKHCGAIYHASVERDERSSTLPHGIGKITYHSPHLPRIIRKPIDIILFSLKLLWTARQKKIDLVICRGSMAALYGIVLKRFLGIPFMVESFEPHSEYMVEGGTWSRSSPEFKIQKWVEEQSIKQASYLMPVAFNHRDHLIHQGVNAERVVVMPCCVDLESFAFNLNDRHEIRKDLNIADQTTVGIYVGKFGDIYLELEAFDLFRKAYDYFNSRFFLIILTPQDQEVVRMRLLNAGLPEKSFFISRVPHEVVSKYLSAADFAFSLVRSAPARKFCSPIKNGEYWANGLPILLPVNVGDDDSIVRNEEAGVIFAVEHLDTNVTFGALKNMLSQGREQLAKKISDVAARYRSFEMISAGYQTIFARLNGRNAIDTTVS